MTRLNVVDIAIVIISVILLMVQVAIISLPGMPDWAQPFIIVALSICVLYFILRGVFGEQDIPDYQEASDAARARKSATDEQVYQRHVQRYGIGYRSIDVQVIINNDGSAEVVRRVVIQAEDVVDEIDTFLLIPTKSESDWDLDVLSVTSESPGRGIDFEIKEEGDRVSLLIGFQPSLIKGDKATYEIREKLPPKFYSFAKSEAELARHNEERDGFGWNINRPTRSLSLRVYFPDYWIPQDSRFFVRYATASGFPATRSQNRESRRSDLRLIGPNGYRHHLKLEVDYPMTGLIYIVTWLPLLQERVTTETDGTVDQA